MTRRRPRSQLYRAARLLGDVGAARSPSRAAKRVANKWIGRNIVRRLWIR